MNNFRDKTPKGFLISFEGLEGSGKSTQLGNLARWFNEKGYDVHVFREPGGTNLGEKIRDILLAPYNRVEQMTELFLFEAARHQLVVEKIQPALAANGVVLLDRFFDATTAYQGFGRGIPLDVVSQLTQIACGCIRPDLTILLDIDVSLGLGRCVKRQGKEYAGADRIESSGVDFLQRVRAGYLEIASREPKRFAVVHVTEDIESTFCAIVQNVEATMKRLGM